MPRIKAITFDLDDTLWEVKPTLVRAEEKTFAWLQANAPKITEAYDLKSLAQWRMKVHTERPELAHQISESRRIAIFEALINVGYPAKEAEEMAEQAFQLFLHARHDVTLFDEVEPLLTALKQKYILGVLTNGNANVRKLPISHYFDFAYSAEQLNASKPAPDMFHAALQASKAKPQELIHIGDHIEHDIQGALDAGCHAIWLNWGDEPLAAQHNAHEIKCLSQILQTIKLIESAD